MKRREPYSNRRCPYLCRHKPHFNRVATLLHAKPQRRRLEARFTALGDGRPHLYRNDNAIDIAVNGVACTVLLRFIIGRQPRRKF